MVFRSCSFVFFGRLFCKRLKGCSFGLCVLDSWSLYFGNGSFRGRIDDYRRVFFIGSGLLRLTSNLFNFRFLWSIRRRGFFRIDFYQSISAFGQPTVDRKAFPNTSEESARVLTKSIKDEFARGFNGVRGLDRRYRRFVGLLDDD